VERYAGQSGCAHSHVAQVRRSRYVSKPLFNRVPSLNKSITCPKMSATGTASAASAPTVPDGEDWPQRLYLLAQTAVTVAHADREAMVARFQDIVARLPTETLEACPAREDVGVTDLLPLFDPATLTPALFLSLLAKCTTGKTRASLQEYADDEALLAQIRETEESESEDLHYLHCRELRVKYDDALLFCPDVEVFASLTGLTVVLHPALRQYGHRTFTGSAGKLVLNHHLKSMEWSAAFAFRTKSSLMDESS
jgi:hypothetical protein